ncbi:hypothetical protein VRU48_12300 [Pedobacter sp. KR3-3]|uniref:Cytochrome C oxidase subunit IV n=1 Tax=Pedobacter albus TaxID=3113905 RepID=A0ABU7I8X7_9SPHI|nr:hypothetical protein [Pedobacter sp. KR3-3]MEE1945893.1 hypothetical protein [Pedobacter sp. KR3-3]
MKKSNLYIFLLNIISFIILIAVYGVISFLLGYGANDKYTNNALSIYLMMVVTQIIFNVLILQKLKTLNMSKLFFALFLIVVLYGGLFLIYQT